MARSRPISFTLDQGSPLAVAVMFFGNGLVMGSSFSRVPGIRDHVGASATQLAFALVCLGIGAIIGMPYTGRLVDRYSSKLVSRVSTAVCLAGWAAVPFADSVVTLGVMLLITGLGVGIGDVAMNVQGHLVEQRRHRVLMPFWHGLFSVGAVVGALAGAGAASLGLPVGWQLPGVSLVLGVAMWYATARYLPDAGLHPGTIKELPDEPILDEAQVLASDRRPPKPRRSMISQTELFLGVIVFATAVGEGAANDWLALVLVDNRAAPPEVGALTYAGFNLTMAFGRFVGGGVIQRFGRAPVLRVAGVLASAGVVVLCLIPSTILAFVGAAAWGLGLSVVFPSAMSAAGEVPGRGGRAIAVVSTIGYGGFLFGAPLIGTLAHLMPLDRALLAVAVLVALVAILSPVARERRTETAGTSKSSEPAL